MGEDSSATTEPVIGPTAIPLADAGPTPKGWVAVEFDAIPVSVPPAWIIEDPGFTCSSAAGGQVSVDEPARLPPAMDCPTATNVVALDTAPSQRVPHARHGVVNGIPAIQDRSGTGADQTVIERTLGMQVDVRGTLAARVVATLRHSPLSVVLDSTVSTVPRGWRQFSFGGLRFSLPSSWTVDHHERWPGCPSNIEPNVLALEHANSDVGGGCGGPSESTAGSVAAQAGMVVATGPAISAAPANATCRTHKGLRLCVDPSPIGGGEQPGHELSLLTAQVDIPGQPDLDQVEIGLAGSGSEARDIFDSVAPATP